MAILAFQKPDKVIMLESTDTFGKFEFRPLEPGYGITIGNALRRVLLSSLEGFAITSDIILNLKQVRFKREVKEEEAETVSFTVTGKQEFTAEDISKALCNFSVLNPELHICSMEPTVKLVVELRIGKGRGYVPSDENKVDSAPMGTIPIDSIFTPIKNVNYSVEDYRVEQKTDYDKLNLEIRSSSTTSCCSPTRRSPLRPLPRRALLRHWMRRHCA